MKTQKLQETKEINSTMKTLKIKESMKIKMKNSVLTIVIFIMTIFEIFNINSVKCQNPGDIDTSFHAPSSLNMSAHSLIQLKDNFILISGNDAIGLYKLKPNGEIDTSFYLNKFGLVNSIDTISVDKIVVGYQKGLLILDNKGKVINILSTNSVLQVKSCSDGGILFISGDSLRKVKIDGSRDLYFKSFYLKNMNYFYVSKNNSIFVTNSSSSKDTLIIKKLKFNGIIDNSFNNNYIFSQNSRINSIVETFDGKFIIGGYFTIAINGNKNIICLNVDGTLYVDFLLTLNDEITTISIQNDGKIIIGGYFTFPSSCIGRFNIDGIFDKTFNVGDGTNGGGVFSSYIQKDGKILISGGFLKYNNIYANRIVRIYNDNILKVGICYVTIIDTSSFGEKTKINWEKISGLGIKNYTIYRESTNGNYDAIANVLFDSISSYIDLNSFPSNYIQKYRMTATDSSGNVSTLSSIKGSIKAISVFNTTGQIEISWNLPSGIDYFTSFTIYAIDSIGNLIYVDTVPKSITQYTVTSITKYLRYVIAVNNIDQCQNGTNKMQSSLISIFSNKISGLKTDIKNEDAIFENNVNIFPNPTLNNKITISYNVNEKSNFNVELLNILGQSIFIENMQKEKGFYNDEIDLDNIGEGFYFIKISNNKNSFVKKVQIIK